MDVKSVVLSVAAALAFAGGALLMKSSQGLQRVIPTVCLVALFGVGAALNAIVVHRSGGDVGVAYVFVIGCETLLAFALAVIAFHEHVSWGKVAAVLMIAAGAMSLAVQQGDESSRPPVDTHDSETLASP